MLLEFFWGNFMPKIKGRLNISSTDGEDYNNHVVGLLENDCYTFSDGDTKTIVKVNEKGLIIKRDNKEISITMEFENNKKIKGTYEIKGLGQVLSLETYTKKLKIDKNNIFVIYDLYINNVYCGSFTFNFDWSEE